MSVTISNLETSKIPKILPEVGDYFIGKIGVGPNSLYVRFHSENEAWKFMLVEDPSSTWSLRGIEDSQHIRVQEIVDIHVEIIKTHEQPNNSSD